VDEAHAESLSRSFSHRAPSCSCSTWHLILLKFVLTAETEFIAGLSGHHETRKADVCVHPEAFEHVGLLVSDPAGTTGPACSLSSHPTARSCSILWPGLGNASGDAVEFARFCRQSPLFYAVASIPYVSRQQSPDTPRGSRPTSIPDKPRRVPCRGVLGTPLRSWPAGRSCKTW